MNLLTAAANTAKLDLAVRGIQGALGITTGDVAANCFSSITPAMWAQMPREQRKRWIGQWLRMEALHA